MSLVLEAEVPIFGSVEFTKKMTFHHLQVSRCPDVS